MSTRFNLTTLAVCVAAQARNPARAGIPAMVICPQRHGLRTVDELRFAYRGALATYVLNDSMSVMLSESMAMKA